MKAFITRDLAPDSIFKTVLSAKGWEVWGESLVELQPKSFMELPPQAQWCFFYSKNGVDFFFRNIEMQQIIVPSYMRWAAIGEGTAAVLRAYTQKVDFVGTGNPDDTAGAFLAQAKGQEVVFVQAENSQQSIENRLQDVIVKHSLSVYCNQIKANFNVPNADVVVFTSPLNAEAYLRTLKSEKCSQKIVSIGNTTAQKLEEWGLTGYKIAQQPNELALAEAVLQFF